MTYKPLDNRFIFEILDFENNYIKPINYDVCKETMSRDKIVYTNHKNICIRNNEKLVYGSLVLQPRSHVDLNSISFDLNIHEKIALDFYELKYFNQAYVGECLKKGKTYFCYYLFALFINKFEKTGKWSVKFNPEITFKFLNMTQKEFLEQLDFSSELSFFNKLNQVMEQIPDQNKKEELAAISNQFMDLNSKSRSLDEPATIVYIYNYENKEKELSMRSDIVLLASISDHQDFLLSSFVPGKNPMNPPTWDEMKRFCVIYWYRDIQRLKQYIDKGTMLLYKKEKKVFNVLFWFVLLGKSRLLIPLFKLEGGQEKFINFFSMNFQDPKNAQKAINNAYVLKSQKKFELSAAFFILAKKYIEAIEILIVYYKDMQLGLLVYRIFETQIRNDQKTEQGIVNLINEWFIDKGKCNNDFFLAAIGYNVLKDYTKMIGAVRKYCSIKEIKYTSVVKREADVFKFNLCTFSPYYHQILEFTKKSSYLKRFTEGQENDDYINNYHIACFNHYKDNNRNYEALEALLELRKIDEEAFNHFLTFNNKQLDNLFTELTMKKIKSLIKKKTFHRLKEKLEKIQIWLSFFKVDFTAFLKKIEYRVYLMNNLELNVFYNLIYRSNDEVKLNFKEYLNNLLSKCKSFIKADILCYFSEYKYLKKLHRIKAVISMLKNLSFGQDKQYSTLYEEFKDEFNDLVSLYFFLIMLKTHNWTYCVKMIDEYNTIDILTKNFEKLVCTIQQWINKHYKFIGKNKIMNFEDDELTYSNCNLIQSLFMQMQLINAFMNVRDFYNKNAKKVNEALLFDIIDFEKELEREFKGMLSLHDREQQLEIIDELQEILSMDVISLKNKNFIMLNPKDALNLEENSLIKSINVNINFWKDNLEALRIQRILEMPLKEQSDDLVGQRENFFNTGIELFRIKTEQTIGFFSNGVITDIAVFSDIEVPELFIIVHGKIRKINLFQTLFKRERINHGYTLYENDNINSISIVGEDLNAEAERMIGTKSAFYRCLFSFIFKSKTVTDKKLLKVLESVLDLKNQKRDELSKIIQMKNHNKLQILFVSVMNSFMIVSAKTLATLCKFEHSEMKKIKFIVTDHNGYKIVLIDHNKNAFIIKYNLSFNELTMMHSIIGKNVYHAVFFENSTKLLFSSYTSSFLIYDFLSSEITEHQLDDSALIKNRMLNFYKTNTLVSINMKSPRITLIDSNGLNKQDVYERNNGTITCFIPVYPKNLIILGYSNGLLEVIDLIMMRPIFEKSFEDEEAGKIGIESLGLLNGFIIASFTNGVLSIVFKI